MSLTYTVKRGSEVGSILTPHKYKCGRYVVSSTKRIIDYRYHATLDDAEKDLRATGDRVRMSDKSSIKPKPPSLIKSELIEGL